MIIFLVFILFIFAVFSVLFIVQVPIFEGHDEIAHYYRIVKGEEIFNLPFRDHANTIFPEEYKQPLNDALKKLDVLYFPFSERTILSYYQLRQPPVYYDLLSFSASRPSLRNRKIDIFINPYFFDGYPNLFYHHSNDHDKHLVLSRNVRYFRFISSIILIFCVILVFLMLMEVFYDRPLAVFTGLLMLLSVPQFIFTGSIINNDILVLFFSYLSIYLFLHLINSDYKSPAALIALIILLPLGLFIKINFLIIIISIVLYFIFIENALKRMHFLYAFLSLCFMLIAIWALDQAYFIQLYTSIRSYVYNISATKWTPLYSIELYRELFKSFFGVFGWKNIYLRRFDYIVYFLLSIMFIILFIRGFYHSIFNKPKNRKLFYFNSIIITVNLILFLGYFVVSGQPQGRFLFISLPSIIIIALLCIDKGKFFESSYSENISAKSSLPATFDKYKIMMIFLCIFFFIWAVYINTFVTVIMLPDRYDVREPLYNTQEIDGNKYKIFPGLGFRFINNEVCYYKLAIIDIYSNSTIENIELVLSYSELSCDHKEQKVITLSDGKLYKGTVYNNSILYRLDNLVYGRNRIYLFSDKILETDKDNKIFTVRDLQKIHLQ